MLPTTLLTLGAILGITTAFPVESALEKWDCPTLLPQHIFQLQENNPDVSYPDTARTTQDMYLYQDVNGATGKLADRVASLISFTPPTSSWGCALKMIFPSDYTFPTYTGATPVVNVYPVPTALPSNPTWNNIMNSKGSLWGTVTVAKGITSYINNETCPATAGGTLSFVFEYADWVGRPGSIEWVNYVNAMNGAGLRGVYLTFDC